MSFWTARVFRAAVALIVRSMVLSAQWAGQQRLLFLERAIAAGEATGDQEGVFISDAFRDLLIRWQVKQRFGAVGKHGSPGSDQPWQPPVPGPGVEVGQPGAR